MGKKHDFYAQSKAVHLTLKKNLIETGQTSYFSPFLYSLFSQSDEYKNIPALDPEKLKVFSTVQEITGKHDFIAEH